MKADAGKNVADKKPADTAKRQQQNGINAAKRKAVIKADFLLKLAAFDGVAVAAFYGLSQWFFEFDHKLIGGICLFLAVDCILAGILIAAYEFCPKKNRLILIHLLASVILASVPFNFF